MKRTIETIDCDYCFNKAEWTNEKVDVCDECHKKYKFKRL